MCIVVIGLSLEWMSAVAEEFTGLIHTWYRNCSLLQDEHALA